MKKSLNFIFQAQELRKYIIKNCLEFFVLIFCIIFYILLLKGLFLKNYSNSLILIFLIFLLFLNFLYFKFYFPKLKFLIYPFSLIFILISHISGGLNGFLKGIPYYLFLIFLPNYSKRILFFFVFLISEFFPFFLNKKIFDILISSFFYSIISLFLIYYLKEIENKIKEKESKIDELSSKLRFFDALKLRKEEVYKGIKEPPLPYEPYSLFKRLLNYLSDTYFEIYKPQTLLFLFYDNIKRGFRVEAGNSKVLNFNPSYLVSENSPLISLGIKQKKTIFLSEEVFSGEKLGIYKESKIYVGSCILTPIIYEGNLYGFIYIDSNEKNYFSSYTKEIFEKIAKKVSIMLKFFFELREKRILAQRYRALFELAMETGRHLEKKEIFEKIFKICKNMFEFNIFIFSKKINENTAEIFYIFDEKDIIKEKYVYLNEDSLFSFAYQNEYPLIFKRIKRETFILNKRNYGIRSAIFVPLKINKKIEYVFSILSFSLDAFSEEDKEIINFLKNQCEIVLERAEIYEREKEKATRDSLTGLYNHRMFHELLEERIKKGTSFTLVMMDIDDFKKLNDFYGHPAGDKVLIEISRILVENIGDKGFCARYGGEEFAICFDFPKEEGIKKCEEIRKLIENWEFYIDDTTKINITASFGVAGFPDDEKKKNLLIEKSDKALYLAKRKGKNKVYIYKKEEAGLF